MHDIPLLRELIILIAVTVVATLVLARFRLPAITGLLIGGALAGPYGLGFVRSVHDIESLAEVGVILLLFSIGLEFPLSRFAQMGRVLFMGGALQVGLTMAAVTGGAYLFGATPAQSWLYGFIAALSSTALVVRMLEQRKEVHTPHGQAILGTLIFQDLCVVPMVLAVPLLAGQGGDNFVPAAGLTALKALLTIGLIYLAGRTVLPWLLHSLSMTQSREAFLLGTLGIGVGIAWLTNFSGLSLALGAFLAGVALAETDFAERARIELMPLRDVLASLFFASMGMLFNWRDMLGEPGIVALLVTGFVLGKGVIASAAALLMKLPPRIAVLSGFGLAQFGEFGFVLARQGQSAGILGEAEMRTLLCAGVISMLLTPLVMRIAPHLAAIMLRLPPLKPASEEHGSAGHGHGHHSGHVVIVGFGTAGKLLAGALRLHGIPYSILELNSKTVRRARAAGEPAYYADAASREALSHFKLDGARALTISINDHQAALRCLRGARELNADLPILVRAPFEGYRASLADAGATQVVTEDFEAGVRVMVLTLKELGIETDFSSPHLQMVHELRDQKASESLPGPLLAAAPLKPPPPDSELP